MSTSHKGLRVPYAKSVHGAKEIQAVIGVLKSNTAFGAHGKLFEKKVARIFGKKFGIMVNSGSSANLLAVELMNLPRGAEVITPLLTFATVVAPLLQKGLVPVFIDVVPGRYLIDVDRIERAITKKTHVLFIPSLIGNVPDMARLRTLAKKHNLWLVEDSCDTLGATFRGEPSGAYSDISTTSFYGSHIINGAGGGGMIMVNDKKLAQRAIMLRGWGRSSSLFGESKASEDLTKRFQTVIDGIPYDSKFVFDEVGYNFLPLEISAAFGLVQLERLPEFSKARSSNFQRLYRFFQAYEDFFILPETTPGVWTNWLAFPLTIRKGVPFTRKDICIYMEQHNIQTRPIFTGNILRQPAFRSMPAKRAELMYPATEQVMRSGFLVGCHQGLSARHIEHIECVVEEFFKKYL